MDVIGDYMTALAAGDGPGLAKTLAGNVRLSPPGISKIFEGRDVVARVLSFVAGACEDFHFVDRLGSANSRHGLVFEARVGTTPLQGLDYVHVDDEGKIDSITVLIRPLPALREFSDNMDRQLGHGHT